MKQSLFAIIVSLLIISACRKNNHTVPDVPVVVTDTTDSWKLILVYDKTTGTTSFPPEWRRREVVITFLPGNKFKGQTLANTLETGTYIQNGDQITFGPFPMTRVNEEPWGQSFLTVLWSCMLQAVSPCVPSTITRDGNFMKIVSPMRYDITLKKL